VRSWLRSYGLMLRWQYLRFRPWVPYVVVLQVLVGVATAIGLKFFIPALDAETARYFATGAPTLAVLTLGLVVVPQYVATAKAEGFHEYMWSLPIPRLVYLAADLTLWLAAAVPGVVLALLTASWRYHFDLHVSPLVVPALVLVAATATAVGYASAHVSPSAQLTTNLANIVVFALFLFSPVTFPPQRLPDWLATAHQFLPVRPAAEVVRATLTAEGSVHLAPAFGILTAWCVASLALTHVVLSRRQ
jgi:ABC-2 type transport system permease protein